MNDFSYAGGELDVFALALNWKKYWVSEIRRYLTGDVLEVGAGLGSNTKFLQPNSYSSWTCLEPDPQLSHRMRENFVSDTELKSCRLETGTIEGLRPELRFDTIVYIDVLEHIEADRKELSLACERLRTGGRIIVLAPAHQWLFTPFDRAIGHFRRYNRQSLAACSPQGCTMERMLYLDSVGLLASLGNRLLLQQKDPTAKQILFWDRMLVPFSRTIDPILLHKIGKSIVGVWKRQ
jgi:SAM-dependent methyltransferase